MQKAALLKENKVTFRNVIIYCHLLSLIYLPQKEMKLYKKYLQK